MIEFITYLSIFIRLISCILLAFLVMPRVWEETKVEDGLGALRKKLFAGFVVFLGINIFVMGANFTRAAHIVPEVETVAVTTLVNAVGQLIISIILVFIYHRDYGREVK